MLILYNWQLYKYLGWLIKVYCIGFCFGTEAECRDMRVTFVTHLIGDGQF